jgi:hypothetical protein
MKSWCVNTLSDKIGANERATEKKLNDNYRNLKREFLVTDIIGADCTYLNF